MILKNSKGEELIPHSSDYGIALHFGSHVKSPEPSSLDDQYSLHYTEGHRAILVCRATGEILKRYNHKIDPDGVNITDGLKDGLNLLLVIKTGEEYRTPYVYFNKEGRVVGYKVVNPLTICRRQKDGKWIKHVRHRGVGFTHPQWRDIHHVLLGVSLAGEFIGTRYFTAKGEVVISTLTELFTPDLVREVTLTNELHDFGELEVLNELLIKYRNHDNSFVKFYHRDTVKSPDFFEFFKHTLRDIRLQSETKRLRKIMKYMDFKDHRHLCDLFTDLNMPMLLHVALLTGAHYRSAKVIEEQPKPNFSQDPLIKLGLLRPEFDFSKTHIRDAYRLMRRIILQTAQFKVK